MTDEMQARLIVIGAAVGVVALIAVGLLVRVTLWRGLLCG